MSESVLEELLIQQLKDRKLKLPKREVKVVEGRRFRWDFYWPMDDLAVEIHGGGNKGRHSREPGASRDCEKIAIAAFQCLTYMQFTSKQVRDGTAVECIKAYLYNEGPPERLLSPPKKKRRKKK